MIMIMRLPLSFDRVFGVAVLALSMAMSLAMVPEACVAEDRTIETETGKIKVETLVRGLDHPWGMAFLPDGRLLLTERAGQMRL
jgi:glucose/arabinose dehydrogenase